MQQLSASGSGSEASGDIIQLDFDKLYEDYRKQIERYWLNQGHNQEDAADRCQDTFVHFLNHLSHHETDLPQSEYHAKNVLYRIAKNIKIDDYRRKKPISLQPIPESDADIRFAELMVEGEDDRICNQLWYQEVLQESLAAMPPMYRKCLLLKYYHGHTQKEIAAIVGSSEAAVSMNVKRGKEYLRKELRRRKSYQVTEEMKSVGIPFAYLATKPYMDMHMQNLLGEEYDWHKEHSEIPLTSKNPVIERKWKRLQKILDSWHEFIDCEENNKSPHFSEAYRYFKQWDESLTITVDRPRWPLGGYSGKDVWWDTEKHRYVSADDGSLTWSDVFDME